MVNQATNHPPWDAVSLDGGGARVWPRRRDTLLSRLRKSLRGRTVHHHPDKPGGETEVSRVLEQHNRPQNPPGSWLVCRSRGSSGTRHDGDQVGVDLANGLHLDGERRGGGVRRGLRWVQSTQSTSLTHSLTSCTRLLIVALLKGVFCNRRLLYYLLNLEPLIPKHVYRLICAAL